MVLVYVALLSLFVLQTLAVIGIVGWARSVRRVLSTFSKYIDAAQELNTVQCNVVQQHNTALTKLISFTSPRITGIQPAMYPHDRCQLCGWTLAKDRAHGCVPGDCSYRPDDGSQEWVTMQMRRTWLETNGVEPWATLARAAGGKQIKLTNIKFTATDNDATGCKN